MSVAVLVWGRLHRCCLHSRNSWWPVNLLAKSVPPDHQLEVCVDLDWRPLNHELLAEVQAQVGAVIQRIGEVSMTRLAVFQQKNMRDAMTREIQSRLRYDTVKAAPRSQFAATSAMKMRWMLRVKDSGQAKARLVLTGLWTLAE